MLLRICQLYNLDVHITRLEVITGERKLCWGTQDWSHVYVTANLANDNSASILLEKLAIELATRCRDSIRATLQVSLKHVGYTDIVKLITVAHVPAVLALREVLLKEQDFYI